MVQEEEDAGGRRHQGIRVRHQNGAAGGEYHVVRRHVLVRVWGSGSRGGDGEEGWVSRCRLERVQRDHEVAALEIRRRPGQRQIHGYVVGLLLHQVWRQR